jgi:hypothetical protein
VEDRRRLSGVFYELYTLLNETVSPVQLEVHGTLRELPYRLYSGGSVPAKERLSAARAFFRTARNELIDRFMQGNHYYYDELDDIL